MQVLRVLSQVRAQRPARKNINRFRSSTVIEEVIEWKIHEPSIAPRHIVGLCRAGCSATVQDVVVEATIRHSPDLGIVSHGMRCNWFANAGESASLLTGTLHGIPSDRLSGDVTWEQPVFGTGGT